LCLAAHRIKRLEMLRWTRPEPDSEERGAVSEPDWRTTNRAHWDELVDLHLGPRGYDLARLRAGQGRLDPIAEAELGPLDGKRVLHLQCHFGADTLILAQRGARVVGLDFSLRAIEAARELAAELGLSDRAGFVQADLYDAPVAINDPRSFDVVFVNWGAICWLPDIRRWAEIVASFLRSGGALFLTEGHPAALVLDDVVATPDGRPGFFASYFATEPIITQATRDYADETATLQNGTTHNWIHPLGDVVSSLLAAGLALDWLHEHDRVTWRMFRMLVRDGDGLWRWPDAAWLPLAFSLRATRRS
jgi:SAM-dependent methyltransferase